MLVLHIGLRTQGRTQQPSAGSKSTSPPPPPSTRSTAPRPSRRTIFSSRRGALPYCFLLTSGDSSSHGWRQYTTYLTCTHNGSVTCAPYTGPVATKQQQIAHTLCPIASCTLDRTSPTNNSGNSTAAPPRATPASLCIAPTHRSQSLPCSSATFAASTSRRTSLSV